MFVLKYSIHLNFIPFKNYYIIRMKKVSSLKKKNIDQWFVVTQKESILCSFPHKTKLLYVIDLAKIFKSSFINNLNWFFRKRVIFLQNTESVVAVRLSRIPPRLLQIRRLKPIFKCSTLTKLCGNTTDHIYESAIMISCIIRVPHKLISWNTACWNKKNVLSNHEICF